LPLKDDVGSADFIKKVARDFLSTMTGRNVWATFRGIRLLSNTDDGLERVSFSAIILRESDGFKELWDIDFPVENFSIQHRNAKFGWITRPE
jgi:hypothetical protein